MKMKSGYVWVLLALATIARASPQEQQGKSETESVAPLWITQQIEEQNRRNLMRPVALTQVEKQFLEEHITTKLKPADPDWQERLIRLMISLKSQVNNTKELYKQALKEEEEQWITPPDLSFTDQPWWESLTPEQKKYWYAHDTQLKKAMLKQQNKVLKAWGEDIVGITKTMEDERALLATPEELRKRAACVAKNQALNAAQPPPSTCF